MVLNVPQGEAEGNVEGREETKLTVFVGAVIKCFVMPSNSCKSKFRLLLPYRELVSFDQWLVTRSPPIRNDIGFGRFKAKAFYARCRRHPLFVYY